MASWITSSALILLVFIILMNEVDFSAGARGARGGSRARFSRSSRVSRSRPYKGTYGLTRSTWIAAFATTRIYGGQRYLLSSRYRRHPDKMPTICRNTYESDDNGTVYNLFVCPRSGEPDDHDYCCGSKNREYCCSYFDSQVTTIAVSVSVCVFVALCAIVAYCLNKKKMCFKKKEKVPEQCPQPTINMAMKEPDAPPPYTVYAPDSTLQGEPVYPEKPTRI